LRIGNRINFQFTFVAISFHLPYAPAIAIFEKDVINLPDAVYEHPHLKVTIQLDAALHFDT
jgi:hypothetical protein